jgi:SAM-dependent methyltransferase
MKGGRRLTVALLLWPHQNVRYFASVQALALKEIALMLAAEPEAGAPRPESLRGLELICFEAPALTEGLLAILRFFSAGYACFKKEGETLRPIEIPQLPYGRDISGVLKYKGKTNEMFTSMMINLAVFSSAFRGRFAQKLEILDPLCGRGTTLFEAARKGYDAAGIEIDKADFSQINLFLPKYLEHNRLKHKIQKGSLTVPGRAAASSVSFEFAQDAKALKIAPERLQFIHGDTLLAASYFGRPRFHALVADLPYGIAHESRDGKGKVALDQMMKKALLAWKKTLLPGAGVALSFNSHTLPLSEARAMLKAAGYEVLAGQEVDGFAHWVEQAILRDIVLARAV